MARKPQSAFAQAAWRYDFLTENGAVSHSTTGSALVDYFAKCGTYRGRPQAAVDADMARLWADSPLIALMIVFYMRMVSRPVRGFFGSEEVQKGQGSRDEFRKCLVWLARNQPDTLHANLWLVPVVGRWNDLWHADLIDVLDRQLVYQLVERGIADPYNRPLLAKYLPRIRSKSNVRNERHARLGDWARGLRHKLGWSQRDYRKFKSSPEHTGHQFQRDMCAGYWDRLDFDRIPGKALFNLVARRGRDRKSAIERHVADRYLAWIDKKPVARFTGHVHELFRAARGRLSAVQRHTYDKQFEGLLELARRDRGGLVGNIWCALDTSGSMQTAVTENATAYDICIGLGIYFAALNDGAFRDQVVMFDNESRVLKLEGTFTEKVKQVVSAKTAWGSTNFQSVIDAIIRLRKDSPEIPVSEYPRTLLVISDMQFNPAAGNAKSNYREAMDRLAMFGLPSVRVVWWWVTGRGGDFPSRLDDEGVIMIGGFDGSVLTLLLGRDQESPVAAPDIGKAVQPGPYDAMLAAIDQEVLRQLKV